MRGQECYDGVYYACGVEVSESKEHDRAHGGVGVFESDADVVSDFVRRTGVPGSNGQGRGGTAHQTFHSEQPLGNPSRTLMGGFERKKLLDVEQGALRLRELAFVKVNHAGEQLLTPRVVRRRVGRHRLLVQTDRITHAIRAHIKLLEERSGVVIPRLEPEHLL